MTIDLPSETEATLTRLAKYNRRDVQAETCEALRWWLQCVPSNRLAVARELAKEESHASSTPQDD